MKTRLIAAASAGLLAILLGGCGGMSVSEKTDRIKLASDPAGATAYADGNELGATPLEISPGAHFRSGFIGMSYRYYGKLSFKRPGCEPYAVEVNDAVLARDVHAKLKCDPGYHPPSLAAAADDKYTERLERIETLRKKGLISDKEYKALRKHILDEL
ncbi:MAG: PEGA domain-containing protein [Gallionellaceae bacterium]|nr:PEGA domain-containing protein [Gallionellaceae bacterium]